MSADPRPIGERFATIAADERTHFGAEALKAGGAAAAHAFAGDFPEAAAEFERAARLCLMAAESRRWERVVTRECQKDGGPS